MFIIPSIYVNIQVPVERSNELAISDHIGKVRNLVGEFRRIRTMTDSSGGRSTGFYVKILVASHLSSFVAGFIVGKQMDADELAMYREAQWRSWWRKTFWTGTAITTLVASVAVFWKVSLSRQNRLSD